MDEKEKFTVEAERENTEICSMTLEEITKNFMGEENFEKSEAAKALLAKKFKSGNPYSLGNLNIFMTDDIAVFILNLVADLCDVENQCRRKVAAMVFDRASHRLINSKCVDVQRNYDSILNFISGYFPTFFGETFDIESECNKTYTSNVFELKNNMICLRGTNEVVINLLADKDIKQLENIIREIEYIPIVSTKELNEVGDNYVFRNKADVDKIVRESGWNPTTLYRKLYDMGIIYKEGDRYSKRSRSKEAENSTGSEQFFGIKRNALEILKGAA